MNQENPAGKPVITEKASGEEITRQSNIIPSIPHLAKAFNSMPYIVLVLNSFQQIIFANHALIDFLESNELEDAYGLRPGDALDCIYARESPGGCGTADGCQSCGVLLAILSSMKGKPGSGECRVTQKKTGEPIDLRIYASRLNLNEEYFTVAAGIDISLEKRQRLLERIFFHDILNVAGTVKFISELIIEAREQELPELGTMLRDAVERMIEELNAQKDLVAAENNELTIEPDKVNSIDILKETVSLYTRQRVATDHQIKIDPEAQNVDFTSDATLLRRVIGNMLKNALEASAYSSEVSLGCTLKDSRVVFWVHNDSFIPKESQIQIFHRSFSTKGAGRGLGTYSIKLLSERYLNGDVSFTTSPEEGTTFFARFPLDLNQADKKG